MRKSFFKLFLYIPLAISSIFPTTMLCMHNAASSSQRAKPKKITSLNVRDLYDAIERDASLEEITKLIGLLKRITGGLHLALKQPRGPQHTTALHLAVQKRHYEITLVLLENISEELINTPDLMGNTALHYAAETNDFPLITALLQKKASVAATNILGDTPFHLLVKKHITSEEEFVTLKGCVLLLLRANANIDAQNNVGNTPLHSIATNQASYYDGIHTFLADCRANLLIRNKAGLIPLKLRITERPA